MALQISGLALGLLFAPVGSHTLWGSALAFRLGLPARGLLASPPGSRPSGAGVLSLAAAGGAARACSTCRVREGRAETAKSRLHVTLGR